MPFDSNGVFSRVMNWTQDQQDGIAIECGRHDDEDDNFANGFNNCFCRDGRAAATGNFNMGNHKIQNLAAGTVTTDAVNKGQIDNITTNMVKTSGNQTIAGVKTFSATISGSINGNAATVTNGVYTTGNQTIDGTKTFSKTISGSINGNAGTVTNGVYTTGNQTIGGTKTFSNTIHGSINGNAATVTNGVYTTGNQTIGGTKTFSTTPVVGTKGNSDSTTSAASTAYVKNILAALYPVGSIYIGTQDSCPLATLISGSTWSLVSKGRALWGGNGTSGSGTTDPSNNNNAPANTTIASGLPNITGTFIANKDWYSGTRSSGAFTTSDVRSSVPGGSNGGEVAKYTLDASRSSSIYGRSSTVQPPAYVVNVWRRTA